MSNKLFGWCWLLGICWLAGCGPSEVGLYPDIGSKAFIEGQGLRKIWGVEGEAVDRRLAISYGIAKLGAQPSGGDIDVLLAFGSVDGILGTDNSLSRHNIVTETGEATVKPIGAPDVDPSPRVFVLGEGTEYIPGSTNLTWKSSSGETQGEASWLPTPSSPFVKQGPSRVYDNQQDFQAGPGFVVTRLIDNTHGRWERSLSGHLVASGVEREVYYRFPDVFFDATNFFPPAEIRKAAMDVTPDGEILYFSFTAEAIQVHSIVGGSANPAAFVNGTLQLKASLPSTALAAKKYPDIFLTFTTARSLDGSKIIGWLLEDEIIRFNTTFVYDIATRQITIKLDRVMTAGRPSAIDEDGNLYLPSADPETGRFQITKVTASGTSVLRKNFVNEQHATGADIVIRGNRIFVIIGGKEIDSANAGIGRPYVLLTEVD
jgi:hypothetical protein